MGNNLRVQPSSYNGKQNKRKPVLSLLSVGSRRYEQGAVRQTDSFIRPAIKRHSSPFSRVSYNFIDPVYKDDTEHISLQRLRKGVCFFFL